MKNSAARIVEVIEVEDTRDYIEENDRFVPIPGTGIFNECERCGRRHEVHATVGLSDGTTAVVGTGCCRGESMEVQKALRSGASKAKKARQFALSEADHVEFVAAVRAWFGEVRTRYEIEARENRRRYLSGEPRSSTGIWIGNFVDVYAANIETEIKDAVALKTISGQRTRLEKILEKLERWLSKTDFVS